MDDARTHKPIKGTPPHTLHSEIESVGIGDKVQSCLSSTLVVFL